MKRGRKELPAPVIHDDVKEDALRQDLEAIDERARTLMEIDKTYGGVAPYQKDRVIAEALFFINQGSESFFEAGKRLILLKEHEGHGGFLKALATIDIDARAAQRMMLVAAKFSNTTALSYLHRSKLLELAVLDDDELEALDKGGTVAGLQIDEIKRMSLRELQAALKAEREEHEATREQIEAKNKKIDELDKKLTKRSKHQPWDEEIKTFTVGLRGVTNDIEENLVAYIEGIKLIQERWDAASNEQRSSTAHLIIDEVNRVLTAAAALQNYVDAEISIHAGARAVPIESDEA